MQWSALRFPESATRPHIARGSIAGNLRAQALPMPYLLQQAGQTDLRTEQTHVSVGWLLPKP
jgi:hypothetical protein